MVVAGVGHLPRHEIGDEQVLRAGVALRGAIERVVEARAMPAALDRRCVQARPAGDLGRGAVMTDGVVVAEAGIPTRRDLPKSGPAGGPLQ